MSKILANIKPGGAMKMTVEGVPGQDCKAVDAPYRASLAGEIASDVETDEALQQPVSNHINQGQ